jgi:hypothetical protein
LGNSVSYEKLVEVMQFYDKDESGQVTWDHERATRVGRQDIKGWSNIW